MESKVNKEEIIKEVDTSGFILPESLTDKIYNSIARIQIYENNIGTGFFMKMPINKKIKNFLFTCNHIINEESINKKIKINIFYGKIGKETKKEIKLDIKERYIRTFANLFNEEEDIDITFIEILDKDNIPEDKYLLADLNYKYGYENYKEKNFILAGYPKLLFDKNERCVSVGKIIQIQNKYTFAHTLNTKSGSSGSPICLIDNNLSLIGIHKGGHKEKPINYGTFIWVIFGILEKENEKDYLEFENNKINKNEEVALGKNIEAAKMKEKEKFNLKDITAYRLGIGVKNKDPKDFEINGNLMYCIIGKFRKIPCSSEKKFSFELTQNSPNIEIYIFEGNDKYIKNNFYIGEINIDNLNKFGKIEYKIKFSVDINYLLTVIITIDSLGIKKEEILTEITHAQVDHEKKKTKIYKK